MQASNARRNAGSYKPIGELEDDLGLIGLTAEAVQEAAHSAERGLEMPGLDMGVGEHDAVLDQLAGLGIEPGCLDWRQAVGPATDLGQQRQGFADPRGLVDWVATAVLAGDEDNHAASLLFRRSCQTRRT